MTSVLIIRTGSANLASVLAAFARLGTPARVTDDAADVEIADLVVLPGVGTFAAAMASLRAQELDRAILRRVEGAMPLLAICLGMQLLCDSSQESPGVAGLGLIPATITRFPSTVRVPQMGWNRISPSAHLAATGLFVRTGYAYFANSYRLGAIPPGWSGAVADHGGPFVAALERGPVLATQFHPELSGDFGLDLIRRWMLAPRKAVARC